MGPGGYAAPLAALVGLTLCVPAEGAGKSIFKLGDEIDHNPLDLLIMYMIVFAVTITLEAIVDHLHHSVTSESGQQIIHHITEEIMILGGISALLVVFQNLGGAEMINLDLALFHYVHFMIFAMAIFFISLVSSLFFTIEGAWQKYSVFESNILQIEKDGTMPEESRKRLLRSYVASTDGGKAMWASICFFRQDLPSQFADVSFTRYMMKKQRRLLLMFLDLTGTTWFALAFLVGFQAAVTYMTQQHTTNDLAIISGWVLSIGLAPVLVLVVISFKIKKEFRLFAFMAEDIRQENKVQPTWPQRNHFWLGDPEYLEVAIQILLLFQVFYLATVTVNFAYRLAVVEGGLILLFLCYVPSGVVFGVVLPVVMPALTILSSVGEFLCLDTITGLAASEKESGKERRIRNRDEANVVPPEHIMDDLQADYQKRIMLAAPEEKKAITASQLRVKIKDKDILKRRQDRERERAKICAECAVKEGVMQCQMCGLLCSQCDQEYHRLRLTKHHERVAPVLPPEEEFDTPPVVAAADPPRSSMKKKKSVPGAPRRMQSKTGSSFSGSPLGASPELLASDSPTFHPSAGTLEDPGDLLMPATSFATSSFRSDDPVIEPGAASASGNPLKKPGRKAGKKGARRPRGDGAASPLGAGDSMHSMPSTSAISNVDL